MPSRKGKDAVDKNTVLGVLLYMCFTNISFLWNCILAWKAQCLSFLKQVWKVENQL